MITDKYIHFFKELETHNNKEWFHEHKKDYENHVKKPFLNLVAALIPEVQKLEPKTSTNPKDALFRINRDIRFSKDKTPYNLLMKAGFSANGKKSVLPGYYLGISADYIHIGGGLFNVKAVELRKIRMYLKNNQEAFNKIIHDPQFKTIFTEIMGEKAKRLDKEFIETVDVLPEIANKQFYAMRKLEIGNRKNSQSIEKIIIAHFKQVGKLNNLLNKALFSA